jgi:hypothetical protein
MSNKLFTYDVLHTELFNSHYKYKYNDFSEGDTKPALFECKAYYSK